MAPASILRVRNLFPLVIALLMAACTSATQPNLGEPPPSTPLPLGTLTIATDSGERTFSVEIAETDDARQRGLMWRSTLPAGEGMAFLFDSPVDGPFWMKNTRIPLTIAFWDPSGRIVDILDMEPCEAEPCPKYPPSEPYVGAVEVNVGTLSGVQPGDTIGLNR